jgi:hypothetical protein
MHLRKLVPLADLMEQLGGGGGRTPASASGTRVAPPREAKIAPTSVSPVAPPREAKLAPLREAPIPPPREAKPAPTSASLAGSALKDALLAEIRSGKKILYELSIAAAQRIEVSDEAVTFTFGANQNAARGNLEQSRPWIEAAVQRLAGRKMDRAVGRPGRCAR